MRHASAVLVLIAATAAPHAAAELSLSVKLGLDRTRVAVTAPAGLQTDPVSRPLVGLGVGIGLGERVVLEPELLYAEQAFTFVEERALSRIDMRGFLLPVSLRVHLGERDRAHPFLLGGAQLHLIGRTRGRTGGQEEDLDPEVRESDVGIHVGGGLAFPAGRGTLLVEARYVRGLRDLTVDPEDEGKTRALLLLAGYRF